ncbi:pro-Pol polyprotein [Nephila pilipes]|uniref:Pro-Pol polyprotein n=1 Tax=Nephila pilipes TaxID=299642 RepID=A0A8X6M6N7_NEPPI|nr:pro-Pol polyprotein [Nephila pilipes]
MCGGLSTVNRRRNSSPPASAELLPNSPTAGDRTIAQCNSSPSGESFLFFISADVTEEIDLSHIAEKGLRNTVSDLVMNYCQNQKPRSTEIKMNIILTDETTVSQRPRRISFAEQKIVDNQIEEWLKNKILRHSCSNYASPIVLTTVLRKTVLRVCV